MNTKCLSEGLKYLLFLLLLPLSAFGDTFILSCDPVTQDANGDPVSGLQGYHWYISKTPGTFGAAVASTSANKFEYTQRLNGTYYAIVRAYNEGGESEKSNQVSFVVKSVVPAAPKNLKRTRKP